MHISEIVRFHVPGASVLQRYLDRSFNYSLWLHCTNCLPTSGPLLEKQSGEYSIHGACQLMFVDGLLMFVDVRWCLLMFVDVCWCLLHQIIYIYIYIYYIYKLRGSLGWHWSSLPAGRPWATWSVGICCHALNGLGNLYVSMCLVVGFLYVCWWIQVSIHVSQVNMP